MNKQIDAKAHINEIAPLHAIGKPFPWPLPQVQDASTLSINETGVALLVLMHAPMVTEILQIQCGAPLETRLTLAQRTTLIHFRLGCGGWIAGYLNAHRAVAAGSQLPSAPTPGYGWSPRTFLVDSRTRVLMALRFIVLDGAFCHEVFTACRAQLALPPEDKAHRAEMQAFSRVPSEGLAERAELRFLSGGGVS